MSLLMILEELGLGLLIEVVAGTQGYNFYIDGFC